MKVQLVGIATSYINMAVNIELDGVVFYWTVNLYVDDKNIWVDRSYSHNGRHEKRKLTKSESRRMKNLAEKTALERYEIYYNRETTAQNRA